MIVILVLLVVLCAYLALSFVRSTRARLVREASMERELLDGSRNRGGAEREHRPFAASLVRIWTGRFGEDAKAGGARTSLR